MLPYTHQDWLPSALANSTLPCALKNSTPFASDSNQNTPFNFRNSLRVPLRSPWCCPLRVTQDSRDNSLFPFLKEALGLMCFQRWIQDFCHWEPSEVVTPGGAWTQNLLKIRGFPLLPENCMILKKREKGGKARVPSPLDPLVVLPIPRKTKIIPLILGSAERLDGELELNGCAWLTEDFLHDSVAGELHVVGPAGNPGRVVLRLLPCAVHGNVYLEVYSTKSVRWDDPLRSVT